MYAWYDDVGVVIWVEFFGERHGSRGVSIGAGGVHGRARDFINDVEVFSRNHAELGGEVARKY